MSMPRTKPWVFILGSTGEKLSTSMDEDRKKLDSLKNLREEIKTRISNNQALLKNLNDQKLLRNSLHIQISGIQDQEKNLDTQLKEDKIKLNKVENLLDSLATSSSYHLFDPNDSNIPQENIHYVKGVRAAKLKQLYNINKNFDYITAASQNIRIQECMVELRKARDKTPSELPNRIVLNGHSRGASACIELAQAIYLEFGNGPPKIAMNIIDPVPGPGRHRNKRMIIPPNVDSAIINYAGNETNSLFNLQKVYFDSTYTTVTTKVYPIDHSLSQGSVRSTENLSKEDIQNAHDQAATEIKKEIQLNNRQMLTALTNPKAEIMNTPTLSDNTIKGKGSRENMTLSVTTNPDSNKNLDPGLKNLHTSLQHTIANPVPPELASFFTKTNHLPFVISPLSTVNKRVRRKQKKFFKRNLKVIRTNSKQEKNKIKSIQGFLQSTQKWLTDGMAGKGTSDPEKEIKNHFLNMAAKHNLDIDVDCIGHANNVVLKLTDKSSKETRILIAGLFKEGNEDTIDKVAKSKFAVKEYYSKLTPSYVKGDNAKIAIVENVPHSLISKANNAKNPQEKINNAISIGRQISELLGFLTTNELIWKDLKPQNVLIREDGNIAISDMKAFRKNNDHDGSDITKEYLPIGALKLVTSDECPKQSTWDAIYSYQLAVILYHQATKVLVENDYHFDEVVKDNTHLLHKCDDEVFSTNEGKRLKFIIQSLANPDPAYQLHHQEAAKLLSVITDEKQYQIQLNEIYKNHPNLRPDPSKSKDYTFEELISIFEKFQFLLKENNNGKLPENFSNLPNYIDKVKQNEGRLNQSQINYYANRINDKIDQLKNLNIPQKEDVVKMTPSPNR